MLTRRQLFVRAGAAAAVASRAAAVPPAEAATPASSPAPGPRAARGVEPPPGRWFVNFDGWIIPARDRDALTGH